MIGTLHTVLPLLSCFLSFKLTVVPYDRLILGSIKGYCFYFCSAVSEIIVCRPSSVPSRRIESNGRGLHEHDYFHCTTLMDSMKNQVYINPGSNSLFKPLPFFELLLFSPSGCPYLTKQKTVEDMGHVKQGSCGESQAKSKFMKMVQNVCLCIFGYRQH